MAPIQGQRVLNSALLQQQRQWVEWLKEKGHVQERRDTGGTQAGHRRDTGGTPALGISSEVAPGLVVDPAASCIRNLSCFSAHL